MLRVLRQHSKFVSFRSFCGETVTIIEAERSDLSNYEKTYQIITNGKPYADDFVKAGRLTSDEMSHLVWSTERLIPTLFEHHKIRGKEHYSINDKLMDLKRFYIPIMGIGTALTGIGLTFLLSSCTCVAGFALFGGIGSFINLTAYNEFKDEKEKLMKNVFQHKSLYLHQISIMHQKMSIYESMYPEIREIAQKRRPLTIDNDSSPPVESLLKLEANKIVKNIEKEYELKDMTKYQKYFTFTP